MIIQIPIWRKTRLLVMKDFSLFTAKCWRSGIQIWKRDRLLFSLVNDEPFYSFTLLPTQHGDQ